MSTDRAGDQGPEGDGATPSTTPQVRHGLAVTFVVLLLLFTLVMVANLDTTGRRAPRSAGDGVLRVRTAFWRWRYSLKDPRPGAVLPVPRRSAKEAKKEGVDVVVFTESVTSCCGGKGAGVAAVVERMARETAGPIAVRWTLVVQSDEAAPPARPKNGSRNVYAVVWDTGGRLGRRYNAYFSPRTYILRDGTLLWAQPWSASEEDQMDLLPVGTIVEQVRRAVAGA